MQHAADGAEGFEAQSDTFGLIVSDLIALLGHVQASINLIENAIARETIAGDQESSNVIVLDDVTPQYMKASLALTGCNRNLDTALQFLLDPGACSERPVRLSTRG